MFCGLHGYRGTCTRCVHTKSFNSDNAILLWPLVRGLLDIWDLNIVATATFNREVAAGEG